MTVGLLQAKENHDALFARPPIKVRERYEASRSNLLSFIGSQATIRVWDNSTQTADGIPREATEVFGIRHQRLLLPPGADPQQTIGWARPLLAQALKLGVKPA